MMDYGENLRQYNDERPKPNIFCVILFVFALFCLATSVFFNFGSQVVEQEFVGDTIIGPITIAEENTVFQLKVTGTNVQKNLWTEVSGQVLDSNKKYLFEFSKELWIETGRDSDGAWVESEIEYDVKVTFPKPGDYYFKFASEQQQIAYNQIKTQAVVVITKLPGSTIPHMWMGGLALIVAIIWNAVRTFKINSPLYPLKRGLQ